MLIDILEHLDEEITTQYRRKKFTDGTNVDTSRILGDSFVCRAITANSRQENPLPWEIWLADGPRRLVAYIGEPRKPWEPGTFFLKSGVSEPCTLYILRRTFRKLCLGSWYLAVTNYEDSVPYGEEETWELKPLSDLEKLPEK